MHLLLQWNLKIASPNYVWVSSKGRVLSYSAEPHSIYKHIFRELNHINELKNFITDQDETIPSIVQIRWKDRFLKSKVFEVKMPLGSSFLYFQDVHYVTVSEVLKECFLQYPWPFCIVSCTEKTILFANSAFLKWLGYESSQIIGKNFWSFLKNSPSNLEDLSYRFYELKDSRGVWLGGSLFYKTFFSAENVTLMCFCPMSLPKAFDDHGDIEILNALPLPCALLDENGNMTALNMLLQKKLGLFTRPSESSVPLARWITEKNRYTFLKALKKMRKNPENIETRSVILQKTDKTAQVFLKYFAPHEANEPGQFLALFEDWEKPEFLKQIEGVETTADPHRLQLLGQLASGIVHDFNNLLTGILGFCDLLLQRHTPEEASFKDIDQIKQSATRAAKLIQQLLAFSKSTPPSQNLINIGQCLGDLSPLIRRIVGPKIFLSVSKCPFPRYAYGDQGQLEQALLNLATNARDSIVNGGSMTIQLRFVSLKQKMSVIRGALAPQKYIVIDIIDTGSGIDPKNIPNIFDPFFSTKDPGQGTGLGLSNVLQIMQQFQGGITVETEIGKGTTFSLYLPEHKGEEHAQESPYPSRAASVAEAKDEKKSIKILLVEDEDPIRLFASRALREKGNDVIEARDGHQAIRLLEKNSDVQVIITDVMMPGIDGPSLANTVKKSHPHIKILFVSGYPEDEVRGQLPKEIQGIYFLQKPFALADLVNRISKLFESKEGDATP